MIDDTSYNQCTDNIIIEKIDKISEEMEFPHFDLNHDQNQEEPGCPSSLVSSLSFDDLPDSVQLEIFSYLPAQDLCRGCSVSRQWWAVCCDPILWQQRLHWDLHTWPIISHTADPNAALESSQSHLQTTDSYASLESSQFHAKHIFSQCSPQGRMPKQSNNFSRITGFLRSLYPAPLHRLVAFGPAMENTKFLLNIMEDKSGRFVDLKFSQGMIAGLGAGLTIKMVSGASCIYTPLYTNTASARRGLNTQQRLQQSKMFENTTRDENGDKQPYRLKPCFHQLVQASQGMIFLADAAKTKQEVSESVVELEAMMNAVPEGKCMPLLVLACVQNYSTKRLSSCDVAQALKLSTLNQPWQVHACVTDGLTGVEKALEWIIRYQR